MEQNTSNHLQVFHLEYLQHLRQTPEFQDLIQELIRLHRPQIPNWRPSHGDAEIEMYKDASARQRGFDYLINLLRGAVNE